jgi:hypothetical protein
MADKNPSVEASGTTRGGSAEGPGRGGGQGGGQGDERRQQRGVGGGPDQPKVPSKKEVDDHPLDEEREQRRD